ncbi:MAG: Uncharacterised protein [Synechococcus sp. MIT S9220]|nr:MAG: Uncharacterised protein [Synechococcus sp. MIT S9220]
MQTRVIGETTILSLNSEGIQNGGEHASGVEIVERFELATGLPSRQATIAADHS